MYDGGDFEAVETFAQRQLTLTPADRDLWRIRMKAAIASGDGARAVTYYDQWRKQRGSHDRGMLAALARATLRHALRVPSATVRIRAIQAVERNRVRSATRLVGHLLADDDHDVAAAAAVALLLDAPAAAETAADLLSSPSARARAIVVEGIARKLRARAEANIIATLRDREPSTRAAAVRALASLRKAKHASLLVAMAKGELNDSPRVAALRALKNAIYDNAIPVATWALNDTSAAARAAAIDVLAARLPRTRAVLMRAATSPDPVVSLQAAIHTAADRPNKITAVARRASQLPTDIPLLSAGDTAVAADRIPIAIAAYRHVLQHGDTQHRIHAARALAALKHPAGTAVLRSLASHEDEDTREQAVRAHRGLPTNPAIIAALGDDSTLVRVAAADVLAR